MTAFLFIPASGDVRLARRVDFANIASLFAEAEEPPRPARGRRTLQIVAAFLLLVVAIGDTIFVAHPGAFYVGAGPHARASAGLNHI